MISDFGLQIADHVIASGAWQSPILAQGAAEWVAGIAIVAVIGAYGAIFTVYGKLAELMKQVHEHAENSTHHPNGENLVYDDVCQERVKRIEASISVLGHLIQEMRKELKSLIQGRGGS